MFKQPALILCSRVQSVVFFGFIRVHLCPSAVPFFKEFAHVYPT
jgi:hypothetical protein